MKRGTITTSANLRSKLAVYLDEAEEGTIVTITRSGHQGVAIINADALNELTTYSDRIKARALEVILTQKPKVVNAMHPMLCEIMNEEEIMNLTKQGE